MRARRTAEDLHGPNADVAENLLKLWDMIAETGEVTAEELERDYRTPDLSEYGDPLEVLPHIEREIETPPDPEEIEVETYADVLNARQQIDEPPTETWRFDPEA